jgi:hypothetical protein
VDDDDSYPLVPGHPRWADRDPGTERMGRTVLWLSVALTGLIGLGMLVLTLR